jgi:hypothetical protein
LAITTYGKVRYQLKTPYRDGTTHVIFEPLDLHQPYEIRQKKHCRQGRKKRGHKNTNR